MWLQPWSIGPVVENMGAVAAAATALLHIWLLARLFFWNRGAALFLAPADALAAAEFILRGDILSYAAFFSAHSFGSVENSS